MRTTPHHHTHEQINFGLAGSIAVTIDEARHELSKLRVTLAPSESAHFAANDGGETVTFGEFQPVRRLDLVPPRQKVIFPAAPEPIAVPSNARVFVDFNPASGRSSSSGQDIGEKELIGAKCLVRVFRLQDTSRGGEIWLAPFPDPESFLYVADGAFRD